MSVDFSMYIIFCLILSLFASDITKKPCLNYVCKVKDCDECGHVKLQASNKKRVKANSRIINGRETKDTYYWMAAIRRRQKMRNIKVPVGEKFGYFYSAGAIITHHIIVTVGHNLCFDKFHSDLGNGWVAYETCPQRGFEYGDLNVQGSNEINVVTGGDFPLTGMPIFPNTDVAIEQFDNNVAAYLYNYEERHDSLFSQNGDFGVIIMNKSIEFRPGIVGSICLLNREKPEYYDSKKQIEVKLAGWGFKYREFTNPVTNIVEKTTCHTNEGKTSNQNSLTTFQERLEFLDCQLLDTDTRTFCNRELLSNNFETLPQDIDLQRVAGFSTLTSNLDLNSIQRDSQQQECERYMIKAREAWEASRETDGKEFDKEIDRIVIEGKDKKKSEIVCYNLRKVARYGVCLTRNKTHNSLAAPRNWGFCSRSCWAPKQLFDDGYDVADFKYFERVPNTNDQLMAGNVFFHIGKRNK